MVILFNDDYAHGLYSAVTNICILYEHIYTHTKTLNIEKFEKVECGKTNKRTLRSTY